MKKIKKMKKVFLFGLFLGYLIFPGVILAAGEDGADCKKNGGECRSLGTTNEFILTPQQACDPQKNMPLFDDCGTEYTCCEKKQEKKPEKPPTEPKVLPPAPNEFPNPLTFKSPKEFLAKVMENLLGIVVTLAIIVIVLGGVLYMLSGGSEKMITRAKACWTGAVIGLAIVLAAPTFLKEIKKILESPVTEADGQQMVDDALTFQEIALNGLEFLLSILGIVAIISLVIGGGMYLTAYGDEERIKTGKKVITYAISGIIVALSSVVIVRQIMTFLNAGE